MKSLQRLLASNTAIEQLPDSVGHLSRLVSLTLNSCKNLTNFPNTICNLTSLKELDLDDCFQLVGLPVELGNLKSLRRLLARNTTIEQLLDSVGHLSRLIILHLDNCKNLTNLPNSICNIRSLQFLGIGGFLNLKNLPESLPKLPLINLRYLDVSGHTSIKQLPKLSSAKYLENLVLKNCSSLESLLPDLPPELRYLDASDCISIKNLSNVASLKCLRELDLTNCRNLRITLKESFLQGLLDYYTFPSGAIPDWLSHQTTGSSVSFDMPPNLANNFIGMFLWTVYSNGDDNAIIDAVISNKTDGTKNYFLGRPKKTCEVHSWVSYIGKPISMKSQDRMEVVFGGVEKVERCGVYLLHNNTSAQIGRKRGRDIDVSETISHLKSPKL